MTGSAKSSRYAPATYRNLPLASLAPATQSPGAGASAIELRRPAIRNQTHVNNVSPYTVQKIFASPMPSTHEDSTVDRIFGDYGTNDAAFSQLRDPAYSENSSPGSNNPYFPPSQRGMRRNPGPNSSSTIGTPEEVFVSSPEDIHTYSQHNSGKSMLGNGDDGGFQSSTDSGAFGGTNHGHNTGVKAYVHSRKNAFYEMPTMWRDSANFNRVRVSVKDVATPLQHPVTPHRLSSEFGYYANSPESYRPGERLSSKDEQDDGADWETIPDRGVLRNSDPSFDPEIPDLHYKQISSSVEANSGVDDIGSLSTDLSIDNGLKLNNNINQTANAERYLQHPPDSRHVSEGFRRVTQDGRLILVPSTSQRLVNNFPNANSRRSVVHHHPAPLLHTNNPFKSAPPEALTSTSAPPGAHTRLSGNTHPTNFKTSSSLQPSSSSEISSSQHNSASATNPMISRRVSNNNAFPGSTPGPKGNRQFHSNAGFQIIDEFYTVPLDTAGPSNKYNSGTMDLKNSYEHIFTKATRADHVNEYGLPLNASGRDYAKREAAAPFVKTPTFGGRFKRRPHYFPRNLGHLRDKEMQNLGLQREFVSDNTCNPVLSRSQILSNNEHNSRPQPVSQLYNSFGLLDADADCVMVSSNMSPENRAICRALQRGKDVVWQAPLPGSAHPHRSILEDANFPTNEMEILYNAEQLAQFREEAAQARANDPNATGRTIASNVHAHLYGASRQVLRDESGLRLQTRYGTLTLVLMFVSLMWPLYWFFTLGKLDLIMDWVSHGKVQNYSQYHKEVAWWLAVITSILVAVGGPAAVVMAIIYATR